jgi:hypothetical protein
MLPTLTPIRRPKSVILELGLLHRSSVNSSPSPVSPGSNLLRYRHSYNNTLAGKIWTHVGSKEPGPRVAAIISVVAPAQNPFDSSSGPADSGKDVSWKDKNMHHFERFPPRWRNNRKRGCPNRSFRQCRRLSFFHPRLISKMPPSSEIDYAPGFDARVRSIAFLRQ